MRFLEAPARRAWQQARATPTAAGVPPLAFAAQLAVAGRLQRMAWVGGLSAWLRGRLASWAPRAACRAAVCSSAPGLSST
eukprot:2686967-Alexandrium_andersonii.AAC.1